MRNIILIIIEVIISYIVLTFLSKKHKKNGIYIYAIIASFISCIMSIKNISIMEISIPTGLGVTTSLLIGGNLLIQNYGKENLKYYLAIIFLTCILGSTFLNLSGLMETSEYNLLANKSYSSIFAYNIRTYVALVISLTISIYISSNLYYLLKRLQNNIFISNIFTFVIVEFIENIIFVLIAYTYNYQIVDIALCICFRYIIKTIIGIIGTIPLYIVNNYNE